jgi:hypothetical protein
MEMILRTWLKKGELQLKLLTISLKLIENFDGLGFLAFKYKRMVKFYPNIWIDLTVKETQY